MGIKIQKTYNKYKIITLPHFPKSKCKKPIIIRSDDPLGIDGRPVTSKNVREVFRNIVKLYEKLLP